MKLMTIMSYPEGSKKRIVTSIKKLNKIEGSSRDGSAKKYTNKICRDNVSHPLYIPTLAFLDNQYHTLLIQYVKYLYPWVYVSIPACAPYIIIILCVCTATHEQCPEKSSTESGPTDESHDQDDASCDDGDNRDGGNGSGDDGENGRDKSAISLDTITLEMEVQELIDRIRTRALFSSHCTKMPTHDSPEAQTDFV